ncbi:hypothetical protein J3Q64DRAFT_1759175 [Phycomyces blakesleeanus]|uniref:GRAM domain-containing protein n=2 Tax=Phycomyces blakesleeanus TaxID=4837 RepID=A0A162TL49_PHYB8|nr:hypothetical protein PHYBLDRAFT_79128 [Phycomyces blakesleeanus NRRL 1555(-)]OAD67963.1 hypothetical protein PHYBLDRAFT_79128 [Phycomyces blakesleeanus NRRL 1555(-)]|eukprot:XP_018286003.1 hypothetical protein PHYBLDRAFT_79128 [Phycomyces blakesleeanus NRRL 1555(-)]
MSLNWAMLGPNGQTPVLLPGEKVFTTQNAVKMVLDCNENGYPGNAGGYWEADGTVTLTNQRIVFAASSPSQTFQTLNVPVLMWKNWKLEQPWFGANYISGILLPVPGGGLSKNGKLSLTFREGGSIEFTTIYRSLLERIGETNQTPQHYEPLPAYEGPSGGASGHTNYPPPPMPVQEGSTSGGNQIVYPPPSPPAPAPFPSSTYMPTPQIQPQCTISPVNQRVYPPPPMPVPYEHPSLNPNPGLDQSLSDLPPSYDTISNK